MSSYSALAWHDFFVAAVGASAALLGLLFVTVSINLEHILKYRHLPGRAAATLGILLTVLVVCCFGSPYPELEGLRMGDSGGDAGVRDPDHLGVGTPPATGQSPQLDSRNLPLLLIPVLVLLGGGARLLAGGGGGIDWLLFGTTLVFIAASINAWVLLVEILR